MIDETCNIHRVLRTRVRARGPSGRAVRGARARGVHAGRVEHAARRAAAVARGRAAGRRRLPRRAARGTRQQRPGQAGPSFGSSRQGSLYSVVISLLLNYILTV